MNMENLHELASFIQEDIFLLPEDRDRVKAELNEANSKSMEIEIQEEIQAPPIPVKGNFTKGILIVHEEQELSPSIMDMLVKMVNACGHSMTEIGLVKAEDLENRSMEDFNALNAHTVLKFGRVKHLINSIPAPTYEVYTEDETEYIFADSLTVISEDKELKKTLWLALQKLFKLKS
ncbi:hypothetical protein [Algoriphagus mannitolivorans]|uniref:hypothetical protein n=1 Tax=Algoriphagus mannitolivorans TaxID=226504 RepID=UPI000423E3F2|nr:hypothetical protein [Algoriphagus mannitolivorans]